MFRRKAMKRVMSRAQLISISLFIATLTLNRSNSAEITFKLRDFAENPLPGRIEMTAPAESKNNQVEKQIWIIVLPYLATGEGKLPNAKCDRPGILFRAASYDQRYYLESSELMKSCVIGDIIFHFRQKDYASILTQALSENSPQLSAASQESKALHVEVVEALKVGNYPAAATKSMLLHDEIEKQFGREAAEPFRILATDVGASGIVSFQPLSFDPKQDKYVLASDAERQVANFQKKIGLSVSGTLNWDTVLKLPDMSSKTIANDFQLDQAR
jgi:hypothetical protein